MTYCLAIFRGNLRKFCPSNLTGPGISFPVLKNQVKNIKSRSETEFGSQKNIMSFIGMKNRKRVNDFCFSGTVRNDYVYLERKTYGFHTTSQSTETGRDR